MSTRTAFTNLTNNAIRPTVAGKRVTRAATMVTRGITNQKMNLKMQGKENVVAGLKNTVKPVSKLSVRPTRVAARRLSKPKPVVLEDDHPMEVEAIVTECQPQRFVHNNNLQVYNHIINF